MFGNRRGSVIGELTGVDQLPNDIYAQWYLAALVAFGVVCVIAAVTFFE